MKLIPGKAGPRVKLDVRESDRLRLSLAIVELIAANTKSPRDIAWACEFKLGVARHLDGAAEQKELFPDPDYATTDTVAPTTPTPETLQF
jgi:hypothetical protein